MEIQRVLARITGARDHDAALDLLKRDHAGVAGLLDIYQELQGNEEKETLVARIILELVIHARIEEELFYPALRQAIVDQDVMDQADVEHAMIRQLLADLNRTSATATHYDAKVRELHALVKHHIQEEEDAMFPEVRDANLNLDALGGQLAAYRAALEARYELAGAQAEIAAFLSAPTVLRATEVAAASRNGRQGRSIAASRTNADRVHRPSASATISARRAAIDSRRRGKILTGQPVTQSNRRSAMGMDQSGTPVLRVVRGKQGGWEVREVGFEKPLSWFDSMEDAKDYAEGIARTKAGIVVEVYSEDGRLQSRVSALG